MDRGAWQATVYEITKSWTQLMTKQQHYLCFASLASALEQEFPPDVLLQSFIHLTIFIEHLLNVKELLDLYKHDPCL